MASKAERERAIETMAIALQHVGSVPYRVSLRWLFYRLLQDGIYTAKADYLRFKSLQGSWRKAFKNGWTPYTLADSTRKPIRRVYGYRSHSQAERGLPRQVSRKIDLHIDHFYQQENYVEIWFEAKAMAGQFEYYTKDIDLIPFGGDPSLAFKWDLAKYLEEQAEYYDKPIKILYFGDCDAKGGQIIDSAARDIQNWCDADIEVVRCGLTPGQARKYKLQTLDKGQYQWEALTDDAAREIILSALAGFTNLGLFDSANATTAKRTKQWQGRIKRVVEDLL